MKAARRRTSGMGEFVKEWKRSSDASFGAEVSELAALTAAASLEALGVEENCLVVTLLALDFLGAVEWRPRVEWADAIRGTIRLALLGTNCLLSAAVHCPQTPEAARRNAGSMTNKKLP